MFTNGIRRIGLLLLIFSVAFTAFYCGHRPEPRNLIRGTASDSLTGAPVDSAQIIVGDTVSAAVTFYSDRLGDYEAYPYTSGVVQVFCRKDTYQTKVITVDLTTNLDAYENVDFELVKE